MPFVCCPTALCHFVLLYFPNLILTTPEKCFLFEWDISGLTLNCGRAGGSGSQEHGITEGAPTLWRTEPIMRWNFPTVALVWAVAAAPQRAFKRQEDGKCICAACCVCGMVLHAAGRVRAQHFSGSGFANLKSSSTREKRNASLG